MYLRACMHSCIVVTKSNEDDASYRILTYVSCSHSSVSHPARARVRSGTHFYSCYHDISSQGTSIYEFTRAHSAHSQTLRPAVACAFRWPQCCFGLCVGPLQLRLRADGSHRLRPYRRPAARRECHWHVSNHPSLPRHSAPIPLRCLCVACARRILPCRALPADLGQPASPNTQREPPRPPPGFSVRC